MKRILLLLLLVIAGQWLSAQEGAYEVKGSISNSSGESIIGATIPLQSDTTATTLTISYAFSAGDQVKPVRTESAATLSLERPVL